MAFLICNVATDSEKVPSNISHLTGTSNVTFTLAFHQLGLFPTPKKWRAGETATNQSITHHQNNL